MTMWPIVLVSLLAAALPEVEVHTLSGEKIVGPLAGLNDERVAVESAAGPVALEVASLAAVSPKAAPSPQRQPAVWVRLVDGSELVGQSYSVEDGQARLVTPLGTRQFGRREVEWVRLQPESEALAEQWTRILEGRIDADLIVIRKEQALDYHRGVLHEVTGETVVFALDGEKLPVKRDKVYGLVYFNAKGRDLPASRCVLIDSEGSRWSVRTLELAGDKLQWTTPAGVTAACSVGAIARIDYSEGKIVYLSDLKPESVRWTPFFGTAANLPSLKAFYAPREDRALAPKPLKVGGKEYSKGLALHSRTEVVYRLPRAFRRLEAVVGIDDSVRPSGDVRLVIRGDDKVLFEGDVAGSDEPKPLDLDIAGVRRISILVDFGKDLDVGDHLDLCEARVIQ